MAVGDVVSDLQSIAAGSYLDIQPGSGAEWVIHNIYHESKVELYFYDGSNSLLFEVDTAFGVFAWYEFHCTNSRRLRVKNTDSSAKLIGYDGVVTK
jgi:hypothetical protein